MFRISHLYQRLTAVTFLVIFLNVTIGQCLCAMAAPASATTKAATPALPSCHGHVAKAQPTGTDHHTKKTAPRSDQQKQGKPGSHDCCKDNSAKVLAGLSVPPAVKVEAPAPFALALPPVLDFSFARFTAWNRAAKVLLVPPQYLKPKIPDIRIFIQSLTV